MHDNYFFILGGEDNEMVEIKAVLASRSLLFYQPQRSWGQIRVERQSLPADAKGKILVWVECLPEGFSEEKLPTNDIVIDHHNDWTQREASLLQILKLFDVKPTHRQELIASIDSVFLRETIARWPQEKDLIWQIWEEGYRKGFPEGKDFQTYEEHCKKLVANAQLLNDTLKLIWECPPSMTLVAALCDIEGFDSIQIVGSERSKSEKPCFYQGNRIVVEKLAQERWNRLYWGARYLGCRAIPGEFAQKVENLYIGL